MTKESIECRLDLIEESLELIFTDINTIKIVQDMLCSHIELELEMQKKAVVSAFDNLKNIENIAKDISKGIVDIV